MKKFLVSCIVILSFLAYSVYQRIFGVQTASVITQKNISSLPTPTPKPAQSTQSQKMPTSTPPPDTNTPTPTPNATSGYKDGTYTGDSVDAFYGMIQVQATISQGKITNIRFLQYPNDRDTSIAINQQADPMLAQEAIQTQSAQVDIISGATDSSSAFVQSLQSALDKAKQ